MLTRYTLLLCTFLVVIHGFDHPRVKCMTTKGPLVIEVYRDWAPLGADRFLELVKDGFFTDIAFFRCVRGFLTQFGISDDPSKKHWHRKEIKDDPNLGLGIRKNYLSYAGGGPNTRSTQLFIAFEDLDFLGKEPWETPFGQVIEGQHTLDSLYKGYNDIPPFGNGPDQQELHRQGNDYIRKMFPKVDFIESCHMVDPEAAAAEAAAQDVQRIAELEASQRQEQASRQEEEEVEAGEGAEEQGNDNDNDAVLDTTPEEPQQWEQHREKQQPRASVGMLRRNDGGNVGHSSEEAEPLEPGKHAVLDGNSASVHIAGREGALMAKAVFFLCLVFAALFFYMRYYGFVRGSKTV